MEKAVAVAKDDLASVRTGRANPNMFSRVVVDYYGALTPLTQLASINIPEARMAIIKPYDAEPAQDDREGDPRLRPRASTRATTARSSGWSFPQLTEERRREMVKVARGKGEDAKVSIRNIRRKAKDELDRIVQGRRGRRGRGRPGGEGAAGHHRPYVAPGRRPGQAQGSRAARGLSLTSSPAIPMSAGPLPVTASPTSPRRTGRPATAPATDRGLPGVAGRRNLVAAIGVGSGSARWSCRRC